MISKKGLSRKGSSCPYIYWKTARRRGFFILFLRRHDRFNCDGKEFSTFCTPASAFLHHSGGDFASLCTLAAGTLSPFARWSLPFLTSPACIFLPISPPPWPFRLCRRRICLRLHAGRCLFSPRRRAFFILFLRRIDPLDDAGGDFVSLCTLGPCLSSPHRRAFFFPFLRRLDPLDDAGGDFVFVCTPVSAFARLTGVHFSFHFSAALILSTMPAGILPSFARWAPAFLHLDDVHFSFCFSAALGVSTMPAGIFLPVESIPVDCPSKSPC